MMNQMGLGMVDLGVQMGCKIMNEVPIWEKLNITIEEAAKYSGIGIHKIRELMKEKDCDFVLNVGHGKKIIKRSKFEKYILSRKSI